MRVGHCKYCHESRMVEVPENATDEEINEAATLDCDCAGASLARKKEYQKEACIAYIDDMMGKDHPEIGEILKNGIEAIQDMKVSKITVNTYIGQTARLSMGKDGIKVELEKKQKEENLA